MHFLHNVGLVQIPNVTKDFWLMIKFENTQDGIEVIVKMSSESSWPEVAEAFYQFLQASGYQVSKEQLAEHYDIYYTKQ